MTTNDDMIARLPKERQERIRRNVAKEVAKYKKKEEEIEWVLEPICEIEPYKPNKSE